MTLTIISTLITLAFSYGTSAISGGIPGTLTSNLIKVATAVGTEVFEELYIDPWISAYFSNKVKEAGGSAYEQILWSTFAETFRESAVSSATRIIGSILINTQTQNQISQSLQITSQESIMDFQQAKQEFLTQQGQASARGDLIESAVSSLLLFAGTILGGFFGGSLTTTLSNTLIVLGTNVDVAQGVFSIALDKKAEPSTIFQTSEGGLFFGEVSDFRTYSVISELQRILEGRDSWKTRISSQDKGFTLQDAQYPDMSDMTLREILKLLSTTTYEGKIIYDPQGGPFGSINHKIIDIILAKQKVGIPLTQFESTIIGIGAWTMGGEKHAVENSLDKRFNRYERLFELYREDNRIIRIECVNAISRLYNAIDLEFPTFSAKRQFNLHYVEKALNNIRSGKHRVIGYKKIQRMIESTLLAIEQKILDKNSKTLEELKKYSKLSLALERTLVRRLKLKYDATHGRMTLYHREALFEELRGLFIYQREGYTRGFMMPLERFMKLIDRPFVSEGLLRDSRISRRINAGDLIDIDFHIQDITLEGLKAIGFETTYNKLKTIKAKASRIIKEFMFNNLYAEPYISQEDIDISTQEGIDYVGHKYDLIRSVAYAIYRVQYSDRFLLTKTPYVNFQKFMKYYLMEPNAITIRKVQDLIDIFSNPKDFNPNDKSVRDLMNKLDRYKDTFAKVAPTVVGTYTHALEELAVLESFILDKKLDITHEEEVDEYGHQIDLMLHIDKSFRTQFAAAIKAKYNLDLKNIKTINFDFSNAYNPRKTKHVWEKFFKNYQSKESVFFVILTNQKLYDRTRADKFIAKLDPILEKMDASLYPEHIRIITMDEFMSFYGIKGEPLENLQAIRKLKDQALSHNPEISNEAFEKLFALYKKAKLTLKLIKTDPGNVVNILKTSQLDLTKFIGDPSKKIDDFFKFFFILISLVLYLY